MLRLDVGLVLGSCLIGCQNTRMNQTEMIPEKKEPVFQGAPAEKRITWDLAGIWSVQRFGTAEKPGKLGRWEAKWTLKVSYVSISNERLYEDEGQGDFYLSRDGEANNLPWKGDILVWVKRNDVVRYFSINEQSFGFLMMTGDDGERYMAVRSD